MLRYRIYVTSPSTKTPRLMVFSQTDTVRSMVVDVFDVRGCSFRILLFISGSALSEAILKCFSHSSTWHS